MANIKYSVTQNSITASIEGLATSSTYSEIYITINGSKSVNLARGGKGYSQSLSYTVNQLSAGTSYYYQWNIKTVAGNTASDTGYIQTESAPVIGGVGTLYVTQMTTNGSLNAEWSSASNATSYKIEVYDYYNGDSIVFSDSGVTSLSYTVSGLSENTYYKIKVYGQRSGSTNGTPSYGYGWTKGYAPAPLTGLSAWAGDAKGGIHMSWYSSTNATGYVWEIYSGTTTNNLVARGITASTSAQYIGLSEYTQYTVKVYATRSGYSNSDYQTAPVTTKDLTPPSISITTSDGKGRMYISYSASDSMSGMRATNTYYTEISNANGTSYSRGAYTTTSYKTFTEDAYGNEFIHDAYYYMKVTAYDVNGNNNSTNVRVQYKVARPTDWYWHSNKTAGQTISLTALEWNSFCTKINLFRQYKNLSNYSFTNAVSGNTITASIVNQAVNAISAMSPPTSAPSTAVANSTTITASFFNTLSRSLNSIL